MKKSKKTFVDKVYRLTKEKAPLSYTIASRHTKRKSLLYFDESTGINRAIRYAKKSKKYFLKKSKTENVNIRADSSLKMDS